MRLVITRRKKAWPPGSCLSNQPAHGESILPQYPTPKSQKALNPNSLSSGGMQHQEYPQTSLPSSCPHVVSAFKQAVNAANPSLKSAMTPSPSPIGSPRCNASQSRLASSPSFTSPQLPPLQYHLSQVAMQPLRPQVPLHGNIPIARYQMTCPTHQLHCQSHQYYHPSQSQHYDVAGIQNAPILKSQTAVPQVQPCQSNASAQPHPQPHHQTPVTLSDNYIPPLPNPPRKRGRKSKQDLLLNRGTLTAEEKKVNHMRAEQHRRALVRAALADLAALIPGMRPPIEGDGANVGLSDGSSRVEILEGARRMLVVLKARNALLNAKLEDPVKPPSELTSNPPPLPD